MIFVDTGAWIALSEEADQYHHEAVAIYAKLKRRKARFLTTDYVIDEAATRLRYDAGHLVAVQFLNLIAQSQRDNVLQSVSIDETSFQEAATIFCQYDTVMLSFTDCTSFAVCRKYGISEAFAFDQHFPMMGIALAIE